MLAHVTTVWRVAPKPPQTINYESLIRLDSKFDKTEVQHLANFNNLVFNLYRPVGRAVTCCLLSRRLRFKSRAGRSVANGSPPFATTRRWAPQTRYTLRRKTRSIIKDLICLVYS